MAGKYEEIAEQTRQNFIDAFWQLYEKKDITKIKVQEICDIAGYHRNTFYHYFTDVYDVLDQIENRIIDDLIKKTDDRLILLKAADSAKMYAEIFEKNKKYLKVFANEEKESKFPLKMNRVLKPIYRNLIFSAIVQKKTNIFRNIIFPVPLQR